MGTDQGANPDATPAVAEVAPRKKVAVERAPAKSAAIWRRYSQAYFGRYGVEPVDNQKTRSQLCLVIDRLGADKAPEVAAFYVSHNAQWYVKKGHAVDSLLSDCEKLCTEWATGLMVTDSQARQADRTQGNANVFGRLIAEAEANERGTTHEH